MRPKLVVGTYWLPGYARRPSGVGESWRYSRLPALLHLLLPLLQLLQHLLGRLHGLRLLLSLRVLSCSLVVCSLILGGLIVGLIVRGVIGGVRLVIRCRIVLRVLTFHHDSISSRRRHGGLDGTVIDWLVVRTRLLRRRRVVLGRAA